MPPAARGGGGSGAVRAGRAFVELFAQDNKLYRALDQAQARLKQFGSFSQRIGLAASAGGAAMLAPLAKTFTDAVARGAKIDQLSKRMGASTESVSSLAYAFETAGVGLEEFEGVLDGLRGKIVSAADANEELIRGFKNLNGRAMLGMPVEKQFDMLADGIKRITLDYDKAEQAQNLFGASGLKMLPILKGGSVALAELRGKAGENNALVSAADAAAATKALQAYRDIWASISGTVAQVGFALLGGADGIKEYSDQVRGAINDAGRWISENRETVVTVFEVGAAVTAGGIALVAFGAVLKATGLIVGAVVLPLKLAAAGVLAVAAAAGIAKVVLTSALLPEILLLTGAGLVLAELFGGDLKQGVKSFATDAAESWGAITEAMKRGDMGAAAGAGLALVSLEWAKAVLYWTKQWNDFKGTFVDGWRDLTTEVAKALMKIQQHAETVKKGGGLATILMTHKATGGAVAAQLDEINRQEQVEAKKARTAAVAAAEKELELAKEKLRIANEIARTGKEGAGGPLGMGGLFQGVLAAANAAEMAAEANKRQMQAARVPNQQELFNSVKGAFTITNAQMQLGYGDNTNKRQLDALNNIAKNAAELPAIRDAVRDNVPRFR